MLFLNGLLMENKKPELSEHLAAVKEIAIDGYEHSSIMGTLENKVGEVTKLKEENLSLNTQIKIMNESLKLMEAEFAFQRSEYEQEIEMYKTNEENLKKSLLKFETHVPIEIEVYQKFQELQTNYEKALERINELENSNDQKLLKLQGKHQKLRNAYQEVLNSASHWQKRIDRRNNAIEELTEKLQKQKDEIDEYKKIVPEGSLTIQKLNQKLQRQTTKALQLESKNAEIEKSLAHCESEFEILTDLLNTKVSINDEWTKIRNKIKSLIENNSNSRKNDSSSSSSASTSPENSPISLKNQSGIKNSNIENSTLELQSNELREMKIKCKELQDNYDRITHYAPQQRIRLLFARTICKNHYYLVNRFLELHSIIFQSDIPTLRPVVLMAVLLNRWIKIRQHTIPDKYDDVSLMSLSSIPKVAFSEKFRQLNEKYADVTAQLVEVKQDLINSQNKINDLQHKINLNDENNEGQRKELQAAQHTIAFLKEHLSSIQEELATAVPSDKFEEVLSKTTYLELEIESLNTDVKHLTDEVEEKDIIISKLTRQIKANEVYKESKEDEIKDIRTISESRCHEIELLKAKLKDKTKELLSLERIIHQTNPLLLNGNSIIEEKKEKTTINPVFLGNPIVK
ncbi:hypothetical protein TRFO_42422 [Tritrichomonas foetus]|uniref:Uncharacterized protein n=1 Tax=Tritrichomonas foetus TaxID=1144522 RepID=A0A1J4KWN3_9EUKA|nr:hypothetical protein TRFO_42422 [Tritrichomonas foetus]|eukprot:OHT15647.1 hypothetical protein TRFO_42422 [Tritrichomonas foetus]